MLRFLTAGESHGKGLLAILDGIPAALMVGEKDINRDLQRRQMGYGRGARMGIECDQAVILSGVRNGKTLGSPIALWVENKDWKNWEQVMGSKSKTEGSQTYGRGIAIPRPGHADLAGGMKFGHRDLRNVLERASARETAARVAAGSVCRKLLAECGITIRSQVIEIGGEKAALPFAKLRTRAYWDGVEKSDFRCGSRAAEQRMKGIIDRARKRGDTVGGVFEIRVWGLPPGLGSYTQWDRKLDGRLAMALMSIPAIKGVEFGMGFEAARIFGSRVHDEIAYRKGRGQNRSTGFYRKTNHAGGLEGGVTNGEELVIRAAMKPISTLLKPKMSVHIHTKKTAPATVERSDVCAVPAAAVVGEGMTALELAGIFLEKFGGDSMSELKRNYTGYLRTLEKY